MGRVLRLKSKRSLHLYLPLLCALLCSGSLVSCGFLGGEAFGSVYSSPSGALTVSFIDVGQGDSSLVQAGGESYLIDAGNPEEGPNVVDFLRSRGVQRLEGMISTSGDADHTGGLADVLDAFTVERIYTPGFPSETMTYTNFLRAVKAEVEEEGATFEEVHAGMRMDWAGVRVDVVNPPPSADGGLFGESNDNSVGVLLTYGTARILLAGDAEEKAEEYMANGPYTGPLTLLKVHHHGSKTSSTPLFLSRFPPKIAVIQSGSDNSYGHPTPEVLERFQRAGVKVFRNDLHGDVVVTITSKDLTVAVQKP